MDRRRCFAAINADGFYGAASYKIHHDQPTSNSSDYSMAGFALRNTLSKHGAVARALRCRILKRPEVPHHGQSVLLARTRRNC